MLLLGAYMQHFITFLVDNWKIILEIFILILSVVVFIVRKPTNKVVSGLMENLYQWCIEAIEQVETEGNLKGTDKLYRAVELVSLNMSFVYPDLKSSAYSFIIHSIIEEILNTPTKKGGFGREKETLKKS